VAYKNIIFISNYLFIILVKMINKSKKCSPKKKSSPSPQEIIFLFCEPNNFKRLTVANQHHNVNGNALMTNMNTGNVASNSFKYSNLLFPRRIKQGSFSEKFTYCLIHHNSFKVLNLKYSKDLIILFCSLYIDFLIS
jgi:hypothetical protein